MPTISLLHNLVVAHCPIDGIAGPYSVDTDMPSIYPAKDGSYWRLDFHPSSNSVQQDAAISLLANIDPTQLVDPVHCEIWQLKHVMSPLQWTGLQNAIVGNSTVSAYFNNPTKMINTGMKTIQNIANTLGISNTQLITIFQQAANTTIT